jgi:hypothetical protein
MATPITHIVLSDKIFNDYFAKFDKNLFIVGTVYPDSRYVTKIDRRRTHDAEMSIDYIQQLSDPFIAGLKFHARVDIQREKYYTKKEIYKKFDHVENIVEALKLLEDRILYKKMQNWDVYVGAFNESDIDDEHLFGAKREDVKRWNKIITNYIERQPDDVSIEKFCSEVGLGKDVAKRYNSSIDAISQKKVILAAIEELYNNFDKIIND